MKIAYILFTIDKTNFHLLIKYLGIDYYECAVYEY